MLRPGRSLRIISCRAKLGKSCRCSKGAAASRKTVSVPGFAIACQPIVKNNAEDEFTIKLAQDEGDGKATKLTVTRWHADACWCDSMQAECGIVPPAELPRNSCDAGSR